MLARSLVCILLLPIATAIGADVKFDGLVDPTETKLLSGKPAVLHFMNGTILGDLSIIGFINDDSIPWPQSSGIAAIVKR